MPDGIDRSETGSPPDFPCRRAALKCSAAGCGVAEVQSVRMGVLQITRPYSTDASDYGVYDTSAIDKDVQAVVTATFRIESQ